VPETYIRKQTMVNAERFITPELKEKEALVLGAEEKIAELEAELFAALRAQVAAECERVLRSARCIAELDVLAELARLAVRNGYVRPEMDESSRIEIRGGRHPVVEVMLGGARFVPNDACLDSERDQLLIVTGPNMAGKSTYLRQVALIVLMAQMGSFVPATSAKIGVVDRIFTRVGASDDLATGQSTFMVEMTEAANILHNATERSLVILDEIGRGTSTFDGLSIAWAVAEYLVNAVGAKTMFATHYHHLNELEQVLPRVRNVRVAVREEGEQITFLYRIVDGGTDRSYGIQVARLAGLPTEVIDRAKEVLHELEAEDLGSHVAPTGAGVQRVAAPVQLQLFEAAPHPVVEKLRKLDLDTMTPLEAMTRLGELQDEIERQESKRGRKGR
jgi:DNA mismatch repair protein MutS